jgi:acetate kinase
VNVLVLSTGSSSLKFQVIDTDLDAIEKNANRQSVRGVLERIGSESLVTLRVEGRGAPHGAAARPPSLDYVLRAFPPAACMRGPTGSPGGHGCLARRRRHERG